MIRPRRETWPTSDDEGLVGMPPNRQRCAYCMETVAVVHVIGVAAPCAGLNLCRACYDTVVEEERKLWP